MTPRKYPHLRSNRPGTRRITGLFLSALLTGGLATATAGAQERPLADLPPQEPGVTLRVFDIQSPLDELCDLKPAQTPNVDRLIPTADWTSTDGFGFTDNFVSQIIGNINVPDAGSYTFRLISDDGSRLFIGGQQVIDHDGLHGAEPKDGEITLTPGYHALHIDHFDRGGGQQVTLQWKPPGAAGFAVVPNSVLSTDAGVVRVTAPGRKECEGSYDTPGDGLPLTSVNPGYTLTDLRPAGFEPQVSAMDWLPGGRLAVTTWGGSSVDEGAVYVLDHVTGDTGPEQVTYKKIAGGLKEPMGVKYVDGKLYVSEKHQLTELSDLDGDNTADEIRKVAEWPYGGNFHEFAFGLLYEDGNFYLNLSVAINYGGATTDPQPAANRGSTIKVNKKTGKVSYLAGGLRTPNGIGRGPEGELFVTDNQGGWLPASKLVHIKQDRFFNHYTNPDGPFDDRTVTKPVLWLPQNEIANSPSTPMLLKKGPFAGQLLFGDVTYGGIQRADLEKVDGEYQGAVFRHTQGLEAGITRISTGPDGAIYAGGLGADGNWGQEGKLRFGLQKLTPNGKSVFDIKTMRATRDGFELTYTKPLSEETAARLTSGAYSVEQWRYVPTPAYGGPKVDEEELPVAAARLSDDRRKVRITVPGLKTDRVVHVRSPRPFASADGEQLWSTEAWYTLNARPGPESPVTAYDAESARLSGGADIDTEHAGYTGGGFVDGFGTPGATATFDVDAPKKGTYDVGLRYANGPHPFTGTKTIGVSVNGGQPLRTSLPSTGAWNRWSTRSERLELRKGRNTITYTYGPEDTGHVNLDMIEVRRPGGRIDLFSGGSVATAWQHTDGRSVEWPHTAEESIEVCCGDIRTKQAFGDFRLHAEFRVPKLPDDVTGQDRGNSGIYLQDRYELQILDSFGVEQLASNEAASIYNKKAADLNGATAPETWQTYDIVFRAARFDAEGKKTDDARISVVWNGETVHDDVAVDGPTGGGDVESAAAGAIRLQDHGNKVRFRNLWIEPLD
ncbi:family 16 glycoside hydrolase [Actinacidiphila glaucinigra]|uniref:Carbohydrate binding module (Family 35) n=1 Tax=Actinacidiphila glaucinigra TaxID=235986 RepID=A0A239IT19_9ACTN|nr:family 16 glycoside hydrolase [Actinacidiphila glaucinigra]SNS96532.1 Carbohydrate binding module (family 35) [Actinacidiphila glaucinigra]